MAMIKCPECGQEISDKAKKCIHCGKIFIEEKEHIEEIKCEECGAILQETDEICSNCGCPVPQEISAVRESQQQVQLTSVKMTKKIKILIIVVVIAIVACIVGVFGYKSSSANKAEKEYQNAYNAYIDDLYSAQLLMLTSGSKAEEMCNLTLQVWSNAIYKTNDATTNKYTKENGSGSFVDFNEALSNLYSDASTESKVSSLESEQSNIKDLIKGLQNPPEGLENCYDTVSDLYDSYKTLVDLATSPSGNYTSYGSNKNDAVSDFMSAYEKLDNQIPDKIETE